MFNKRKDTISYALLYLVMRLGEINNKARTYGTKEELYEAEIHLIKAIYEGDGLSVTALAKKMNVTKGAVSQILNRLAHKGMIIKQTDPKNLSRLCISLSPTGEIAYQNHELLHQQFDACVISALQQSSEEEKKFLLNFLDRLEMKIDDFEKKGKL